MWTSLMRPDAPLLMETADFRHAKCFATKATSSSLALPSTGGDLSCACQMPPLTDSSSKLIRALGLTFTRIVLTAFVKPFFPHKGRQFGSIS